MNALSTWPVPGVIRQPPPATAGVNGSLSMWGAVGSALRRGRPDPTAEVLMPRTLPVLLVDDLTPYHFVPDRDRGLTLRKGAPPKVIKDAAADLADGKVSMTEFLDRIGVPQA